MAGRKVTIELDVQDAAAVSAWQRAKNSVNAYENAIARTSNRSRQAAKTTGQMLSGAAVGIGRLSSQMLGFGSALAGIYTVVQLLRSEYENMVQKQKQAGDVRLGFEQAVASNIANVLPTGLFAQGELKKRALEIGRDTGTSPTRAVSLIGSAVTSAGISAENPAEKRFAIEAALATARYGPELDITSAEELAGVAASQAKVFGTTPRKAIGFMEQVRAQSNVRDQGNFLRNIAPGFAALQALGFSEGEAGALKATISQRAGDTSGELTITSALALGKALFERFGDVEKFQGDDGRFRAVLAMEALARDPEMARTFMRGGVFENLGAGMDSGKFGKAALGKGRTIPAIRNLFDTSGRFPDYADFQNRMNLLSAGFAGGGAEFDRLVAAKREGSPLSYIKRRSDAARELIQLGDPTGVSGILREQLTKLSQSAGDSKVRQNLQKLGFEVGSKLGEDPTAALEYFLSQGTSTANRLGEDQRIARYAHGRSTVRIADKVIPATEEGKRIASELRAMVLGIEEVVQLLKAPKELRLKGHRGTEQHDVRAGAGPAGVPQARPAARLGPRIGGRPDGVPAGAGFGMGAGFAGGFEG